MKQTVQSDPNLARNSAEPAHSRPAQRQTIVAGSRLAQLAAAVNASPRVETLAPLKNGAQQSPRVQGLMNMAAEINQSVPAQLRVTAMDDSPNQEHETLDLDIPSWPSPPISTLPPVQRVLGYHVVTNAPEPAAQQESEGSDDEEPMREVQLRKAPNGAVKKAYLQIGQGVTVTEEQGEWAKVESGVGTGWMLSEYLTRQPNPSDEENTSWEQAKGQPFGSDDSDPALEDVRQGKLDNCFLLAPLAAIAHAPDGPALIRKILVGAGLGKYRVGFHEITDENDVGEEREQVTVDNWFPSNAKDAFLYSPAGKKLEDANFPTWSAIIEKAYAWWGEEEEQSGSEELSEEEEEEEEEEDKQGYAASEMGAASVALANLLGVIPRSLSWNVKSKETRTLEGVHDTSTLWHQNAITEGEDQDKEDFKPESVKNISSNALFKALHDLRGDRNNVLVAESNNAENGESDHETYLNPDDPENLQIREGHVYVITSVYKHTIRLWDPITQERTARMPIGKFKTLFNRVLTANIGESPAMET
jgi:hypothetical protein